MRDIAKIKEFGRNLCAERNRLGLSQEGLGNKISMDGNYIGRIERAEVNPTLTTIIAILEALNLSFETLYRTKSDTLK
jgi:transcriptional regulator with XRE-family HTH domain